MRPLPPLRRQVRPDIRFAWIPRPHAARYSTTGVSLPYLARDTSEVLAKDTAHIGFRVLAR